MRRRIAAYDHVRDLPVAATASVDEVRATVGARFDLDRPQALGAVFSAAAELLREHTLHITHPRYFGLFNPSVHPSGVLADALVALYNPQVGGWSHAPAANEMERLVLRRLARSLGFGDDVAAQFTSGGNEANHTAVLAALAQRFPSWMQEGVRALPGRPVIYLSRESHHSFVKIARAAGLGTGALREIDVDGSFRMRVDALAEAIARDRAEGDVPLMVVASAGTTGAGPSIPFRIQDVDAVVPALHRTQALFAFAEHGGDGIARFVEHQATMGDVIRSRLQDAGWTVVNDSPLPLICFTHPSLDRAEQATKSLVTRILERRRVWISDVRLPTHGWVLRACVTSYRTNEGDVGVLVEELGRQVDAR